MDQHINRAPRGRHAVILGGSITGLLAARVLADHFDAVTLVERDRLPAGDEPRAGTPQDQHVHALLLRGRQIMERLLPGLEAELVAAGVPTFDQGLHGRTLLSAGWSPIVRSGLVVFACSRALLESRIRRRVLANPRVRVLQGYDATGFLVDEARTGITGVRVRRRTPPREALAAGETLPADLVVDACGRGSRTAEWLEALGYPQPQTSVVNSFVGYASRWYERRDNPAGAQQHDWSSLLLASQPPKATRGAVMLAVESGRWSCTLYGQMRDYPPTDEAGFLEFARALPSPLVYETIKDARPLSPIYGYRRMENCLRHYDRMARWPERLVVLGDAVCAFNPTYAQGMTVAAMGVLALDTHLRELPGDDLAGMAQRFQKELAKLVMDPWTMATSEDSRWPGTEGSQLQPSTRFTHWYMDQVMQALPTRPDIYQIFLQVTHMVTPASALFKPAIVAQVLRQASSLRPRTQPAALEALGQGL